MSMQEKPTNSDIYAAISQTPGATRLQEECSRPEHAERVRVILEEKIHVAPQGSIAELLSYIGLEKRDGLYPGMNGKDIVDIGGGFSRSAFIFPNARSVTIVDPVFQQDTAGIRDSIRSDLGKMERMLTHTQSLLQQHPENRECIMKNLLAQSKTLHEMEGWRTFFDGPPTNVRLDGSFGEEIEHIPAKSVDLVLMNFILAKDTAQYGKILGHAYRIAKSGWLIAFSDNFTDNERYVYEQIIGTCVAPIQWKVRDAKIYGLLRKN